MGKKVKRAIVKLMIFFAALVLSLVPAFTQRYFLIVPSDDIARLASSPALYAVVAAHAVGTHPVSAPSASIGVRSVCTSEIKSSTAAAVSRLMHVHVTVLSVVVLPIVSSHVGSLLSLVPAAVQR